MGVDVDFHILNMEVARKNLVLVGFEFRNLGYMGADYCVMFLQDTEEVVGLVLVDYIHL